MNNFLDLWRNPLSLRDFSQMQKALDRMQDDFFSAPMERGNFLPKLELTEDKQKYMAKFDLPGMNKDQIKIEVHDHTLTISGERKSEKTETGEKSSYSEVSYGSFQRSVSLPQAVDPERSSAVFDKGVLTVMMEKKVASNAKQIAIK